MEPNTQVLPEAGQGLQEAAGGANVSLQTEVYFKYGGHVEACSI